ncbi:ATP-dependent helicase/nuclease subunit A [bacterium BMS3Abin10]|nr:ATP-dependent helicase/nuclease subunit A [bacterium BMS3Abin10]
MIKAMNKYLDINKSVMISSPAGSGKTEKLARRYIALLRSGVDVERILAITFTDKAAAEMKQRILRILRQEDKELFGKLLEKMSLMRVSTIHSFCGTLLRRFSFETSLDPNYRIEDAIDSRIAWDRILYEVLMEVGTTRSRAGKGKAGNELLFQSLSENGFKGLDRLKTTINYLFEKNPFSLEAGLPGPSLASEMFAKELADWSGAAAAIENYAELFRDDGFTGLVAAEKHFLTKSGEPRKRAPAYAKGIVDYQGWASTMFKYWSEKSKEEFRKRAERLKAVFNKCFEKYSDKKALRGLLDFSDLEYMTFRLLTEDQEWSNILYAFDEKTDHILVDEFQDTNNFQWGIIDKLTEEWRSGLGAKREEGKVPTIFLVGDEKQSIYFFRGANVEIFNRAKIKLEEWLKREFYYEEVTENFRSLPAIIDLTNALFSKIMRTVEPDEAGGEGMPSWMTRYSAFKACRTDTKDAGKVEIILLDDDEATTAETRQKEADVIAKRIQGLIDDYRITEKAETPAGSRPCRYMDIALLLRKRTHLKKYEQAFRRYNIPFVAVKGIGFYQEPEVAILRALTYFLSNPYDDYSLYILLKSPFFSIDEGSIVKAVNSEGDCLFSKWRKTRDGSEKLLDEWLLKIQQVPLSELIEEALSRTKAWEFFHEAQQRANVKKFIKLVEDLEADGKSLLKIRDFLERTEERADEPKANVNTEGMDAVRIMTIHGAKGLEFPVVFVPGIDEGFFTKAGDSLIYDTEGKLFFKYVPQSAVRRMDEDFILHSRKENEEQKRLFYVAVTRAEQAFFLTGRWSENNNSFLGFLKQGLGLNRVEPGAQSTEHRDRKTENRKQKTKKGPQWGTSVQLEGLSVISEQEIKALYKKRPRPKTSKAPSAPEKFIPIRVEKPLIWNAVTETIDIRRQHGKDWAVLGDVIHRLFEDISNGVITEGDMRARAQKLLMTKGIVNKQNERLLSVIGEDVSLLQEKGIWQDVIMPRDNSFSELPFVLGSGDTVYTGRIDRVINEDGVFKVYDYKTFPVDKKEMSYLLKGYASQLRIYKEAVKNLFNAEDVRSYIIFTHTGEIKEAG